MDTDIIDNNTANGTENRFSWRRVLEFAGIYRYLIKRQLLVYGLTSLFITILTLIPFSGVIQTGFYSLFTSILSLMYYFSPLILCRFGDFRPVVYMTPVKPSEKTAFYVIYFLVVLPFVVYLLPWIGWTIIYKFPEIASSELSWLVSFSIKANIFGIFSSIVQSAAIIMTCFYVVLSSRNSRFVKGIIAVLGYMFVLGILGGITGVLLSKQNRIGEILMMSPNKPQVQESLLSMLSDMRMPLMILVVALTAYSILLIWLTYRKLRHPDI